MKLLRFKVQNFNSIKDSGWVEVDQLSCLLGTNEAGKTNLLQGLWKLNPANKEPIVPLSDYPRSEYAKFDAERDDNPFITADFQPSEGELTGDEEADDENDEEEANGEINKTNSTFSTVRFARLYDGEYRCWSLDEKGTAVHSITGEEFQKYYRKLPQFVYLSDYGNLDSEIARASPDGPARVAGRTGSGGGVSAALLARLLAHRAGVEQAQNQTVHLRGPLV